MKKTIQHISLLLAVLLTAGLSSCIKDDYADTSKDTATVNLVFDTRASGQDGSTVQGEAGEGIKTLRVIIVDTDKGIVDVNELRDFSNETPQPVLQKTLTILALPAGNKEFYVIANEASVGLTGLDKPAAGKDFGDTEKAALLGKVINDANRTYFPATAADIEAKGLPIAGMATKEITGTEDQDIEIPITRAVAKFVLYVTNESKEAFDLTGVTLGNFIANQTRLFPGQAALTGINHDEWTASCTANVTVGAVEQQVFTGYFYETGNGLSAENFTLALTSLTDGFEALATPVQINFTQAGRTSINRNEQVEIRATVDINREVKVDNLEIVVLSWGDKEITVPPFE